MPCGCLVALIATAFPRFAIVLIWLFSDWFHDVYPSRLIGGLGLLLMPYTTLWYSVVANVWDRDWGFLQLAVFVIAVMSDVGALGGAGVTGRRRK